MFLSRLTVSLAASAISALALAASGANAAPPVVNETTHYLNEPFDGIGLNCGTGNLAESNGLYSGVLRTQIQPDGSVRLHGSTRGTDSLDDLPADGVVDATTRFVLTFTDLWLPAGAESHTETGAGTLTLTATGETLRFRFVVRLLIGPDGTVRLDTFRVSCG